METNPIFKEMLKYENYIAAWNKLEKKESASGIDGITLDSFYEDMDRNIEECIKSKLFSRKLCIFFYSPVIPNK